MIILRSKEFNSKAQKARRRAYDLQQGSTARYAFIGGDPDAPTDINKTRVNAQLQDKMIGRKKTMDLIKKGEEGAVIKVNNEKELDEIIRARNLLKAGRDRNRDRVFKNLYEGERKNVNNLINLRAELQKYGKSPCSKDIKKAVEQSKIARHEAKAAELHAKKVAGQKLVKNLKTVGKVLH